MTDTFELIYGVNEETGDNWEGYIGGWDPKNEDAGYLAALPDDQEIMALRSSGYEEITLDARQVLKLENQKNQGACQGHSVTSSLEFCYYLSGGDLDTQLSRAMGYYETQRIDGIRGDRGSTISGGVKLAKTTGICIESLWPYPNGYNPQRPTNYSEVLDSAKEFKLKTSIRLSSYDAIRTFLGSGQGAISIGIGWSNAMNRAVVESYQKGSGGHAICLPSLSKRKDAQGRPYVWMMNSWGPNWANKGWSEWSPNSINQMMRDRWTVAIGLSDMLKAKPRRYTEAMWKAVASKA